MEDFEEQSGLLDEDPALDYILYEEMQKDNGSKKPSDKSGCCVFLLAVSSCPSINGFFARSLRHTQKIMLGISHVCLCLFFSQSLTSNENPHFWTDTSSLVAAGVGIR